MKERQIKKQKQFKKIRKFQHNNGMKKKKIKILNYKIDAIRKSRKILFLGELYHA
jgi:hypothetical protein